MLFRTLVVLSCVLSITVLTNGQNRFYGKIGNNYIGGYGTLTGLSQGNYGNEKVKIDVYYESLCPGCKHFDTHELKQTVLELDPYLNVDLHPYGNAKTIDHGYGNFEFIGQHGPAEVYGNKLHACAIDILQNATMAVLFNSCLMEQPGQGSDDAAADVCGNAYYVNSNAIKQCAKSNRGSQLLKHQGDLSKMVDFKTVPTVFVNEISARTDHFKEDVCRAFTYPPPQCMY